MSYVPIKALHNFGIVLYNIDVSQIVLKPTLNPEMTLNVWFVDKHIFNLFGAQSSSPWNAFSGFSAPAP